jgi:signal transduction histidine kinase
LRSPLAASRADLELAMTHPQQVDNARVMTDLLKDNDRMSGLVRDLLYLAQSDEGTATPITALVDLDDVVREEARRTRSRDGVGTDLSGVRPVEVRGNTEHLGRLVANLLDNAVRHAQHSVAVSLDIVDTDAVLVVTDDGLGIPEELSERIFERFSRLDASRTRDSGGTGLGLAITREIAAAHGGTVIAAPAPIGARMVVTLPIMGPPRRRR